MPDPARSFGSDRNRINNTDSSVMRIRIQESQLSGDPCRSGYETLVEKHLQHVITAVIVMFPCRGVAQNGQADWKPLVPQGMGIPPQYFTVFAFAMWPHGTKQ
jgi:hypothetical protein